MNPIEKSMQFGRDLLEVNAEWMRKLAEFDGQSMRKYVEFNQEFGSKLPEVKDVQSFLELQRAYAEQLWSGAQETFKARGELVKEAVEANGALWRRVVETASPVEEAKAA